MASINAEPSAEVSEITARNSTESPLLRLPGELRNRVFAHLLGGYTIVVIHHKRPDTLGLYDGLKLTLSLTTSLESYPPRKSLYMGPRMINGRYLNEADEKERNECREKELKEARETREKRRVPQILTITQACRQIYQETALLQFKSNIFHFTSVDALQVFTEDTTLHQRRAITTISVSEQYTFTVSGSRRPRSLPHMRVFLPGLKRVCLMKHALRWFGADTTREKLVEAVPGLALGGEEGKGVWIGYFDVRDPNAVLEEAFGITIGSDVASSS
ncbi:hypothetical protein J4E81_008039 [Alternaria sp. BMP 2799]|nr:hypothetical protein J4E81_008039 [Alternaria sp. BMP 2799]